MTQMIREDVECVASRRGPVQNPRPLEAMYTGDPTALT